LSAVFIAEVSIIYLMLLKFCGVVSHLLQNLPYGSNGNYVDVYLPPNASSPRPVIVFVYGGTWGSGDKNMYGLLCSELARSLSSVVLCPNYSIYPKVCFSVNHVYSLILLLHICKHEKNEHYVVCLCLVSSCM
jgi:acetyl esterase/lipase